MHIEVRHQTWWYQDVDDSVKIIQSDYSRDIKFFIQGMEAKKYIVKRK